MLANSFWDLGTLYVFLSFAPLQKEGSFLDTEEQWRVFFFSPYPVEWRILIKNRTHPAPHRGLMHLQTAPEGDGKISRGVGGEKKGWSATMRYLNVGGVSEGEWREKKKKQMLTCKEEWFDLVAAHTLERRTAADAYDCMHTRALTRNMSATCSAQARHAGGRVVKWNVLSPLR